MNESVEAGHLVFHQKTTVNYAVEAQIFIDLLGKGKFFYRRENGEEINMQGRLLRLLSKVTDVALEKEIEDALKGSVKIRLA